MSTIVSWPGGAANPTISNYPIPAAGEVNWATLSAFLIALGQSAQGTTFQKFADRVATTSPVTVSVNDCVIITNLAVSGSVSVTLPAGSDKAVYFIVDGKGDAGTNNITVLPSGSDTINGSSSFVMANNSQGIMVVYNAGTTNWVIVQNSNPSNSQSTALPNGKIWIGNASNIATAQALSGDATITNAGVITLNSTNSSLVTCSGLTTASSLATVGTIGTGVWQGTTIAVAHGGTGVTSLGNLTEATSSVLTITGGTGSVINTTTIQVLKAGSSQSGYLSSTDWTTFNNKQGSGSYITALTGDVTASGPGSSVATLAATSNATLVTLSALTTASSLATVGTITTGVWTGTTIAVTNGGTGLTSGTSGGILGYTASGTLASSAALTINQLIIGGGAGATPSTLAAGSQYQVLVMGSSIPGYGQVNLAQSAAITGTLPLGNGGTGQTTASAAINALVPSQSGQTGNVLGTNGTAVSWVATLSNPMTTKGDIIYENATPAPARLPIGTTGQYLGVASGLPAWTSWGAVTQTTKTSGSGTYNVPTGVIWIRVILVGGGGGGSASGTGSVGAASNGSATTFGTTFLSAGGGTAAVWNSTLGQGGTNSISTAVGIQIPGSPGQPWGEFASISTVASCGGGGGNTPFFAGGGSGGITGAASAAGGTNTGGGGGGAGGGLTSNSVAGGGGGSGGYVDVIIYSPSSSYSYAVGGGGSGGTAGTSGYAGAAGGSGVIYIQEHYY